jgi:hypothetical protein
MELHFHILQQDCLEDVRMLKHLWMSCNMKSMKSLCTLCHHRILHSGNKQKAPKTHILVVFEFPMLTSKLVQFS